MEEIPSKRLPEKVIWMRLNYDLSLPQIITNAVTVMDTLQKSYYHYLQQQYIITLKGCRINCSTRLCDLPDTTEGNPIIVRTQIRVCVKINNSKSKYYEKPPFYTLQKMLSVTDDCIITCDGAYIDSSKMICDLPSTTEVNPIIVRTVIETFVKIDDSKANIYLGSPFDTVQELLKNILDIGQCRVTLNGCRIKCSEKICDLPDTTEENPVIVRTQIEVWIKHVDRSSEPVMYNASDTVDKITLNKFFVRHKDVMVKYGFLADLQTSSKYPLHVLPKQVKFTVSGEPYIKHVDETDTFQNFIASKFGLTNFTVFCSGTEISSCTRFADFIWKYPSGNCMVTSNVQADRVAFSVESSASKMGAQANLTNNLMDAPLYLHWFGLYVYSKYHQPDSHPDAKTAAKHIKGILECEYNENRIYSTDEPIYTSQVCCVLDHYFKSLDCHCLHQLPLKSKGKPDFFVVALRNGTISNEPKLIADFKTKADEIPKAENQSLAYCFHLLNSLSKPTPILTMPCSREKFKLWLCLPHSQFMKEGSARKLVRIQILESSVKDELEMAKFLEATKCAIQQLPNVSDTYTFEPFKDVRSDEEYKKNRVYRCKDKVYKVYDTECHTGNPNVDIIKKISDRYLPGLELKPLVPSNKCQPSAKCERYFCLIYDNIDNVGGLKCYADFLPIIKAIDVLHTCRYVHSDIRSDNLVFSKHDSKLLDFDLSDKVGTKYPCTYNHRGIPERHPNAKAGQPRSTVHDKYAIVNIMKRKLTLPEENLTLLTTIENNLHSKNEEACTLTELLKDII